jgi:ribosomal protein S20
VFLAGGVSAVVLLVGLGAAGAIAASRAFSPNDESKAVLEDAAGQLGVTPAELSDALEQALKNRIDEAVKSGKLSKEQGARLKERLDSGEVPLFAGPGLFRGPALGLHRFGPGWGRFHFGFGSRSMKGFDLLEVAADYLGMSEADLRVALRDETLAAIARDREKSVDGLVKALVAAEEKAIDEAVADGRITKAHASEIKSKLAEHLDALVRGELRRGDGPHRRFWPGSGFPRGPPGLFGGPRD